MYNLKINYQMTEAAGSPSDLLSRRCITLLKKALGPEIWPNSDIKLTWFDKILMSVEGQTPNFNNICTALELLTFLLGILVSEIYFLISNFVFLLYFYDWFSGFLFPIPSN